MTRLALAADLGGTQVRAALVADDGEIISSHVERAKAHAGPGAVVEQIVELLDAVRPNGGSAVAGIGISAPGPLDTRTGTVLVLQLMIGFGEFPLRSTLSERLGLEVRLENDGIAAAVGEWLHGAGRGCSDFVYVTVSTGIGGGIVCNGRPVRGRRGLAGHVGHTFHRRDTSRFGGGEMPCWEDHCSDTAFGARARGCVAGRPESSLAAATGINSYTVFATAAVGDELAVELVEEAGTLGLGLVSLLHVLDPGKILIGEGWPTSSTR